MDTIKAAVDVIVDAAVASDSIEDGLYKLVRTLLDGDDMDPAVKGSSLWWRATFWQRQTGPN